MKKLLTPSHRREFAELVKDKNLQPDQIAKICGVTLSAVYNWISGRNSPSKKNITRLKSGQNEKPPDIKTEQILVEMNRKIDHITDLLRMALKLQPEEEGKKIREDNAAFG